MAATQKAKRKKSKPARGLKVLKHNLSSVSGRGPVAIASQKGSYRANPIANPNVEYLCLVVQNTQGEWCFVRSTGSYLSTTLEPIVFRYSDSHRLLDIWKRVTIDNAIPWDDPVRPASLRIVKYNLKVVDTTLTLFDPGEAREYQRLSAVAKLTNQEAKLLGMEKIKARQNLAFNPNPTNNDAQILNTLMHNSAKLSLDSFLEILED